MRVNGSDKLKTTGCARLRASAWLPIDFTYIDELPLRLALQRLHEKCHNG